MAYNHPGGAHSSSFLSTSAPNQLSDGEEDDNDDIVGSYLQDSQSFLNVWSQSMNGATSALGNGEF